MGYAPRNCFRCKAEDSFVPGARAGTYRCTSCGHIYEPGGYKQKCYGGGCNGQAVSDVYAVVGGEKVSTGKWGCRNPKCRFYFAKVLQRATVEDEVFKARMAEARRRHGIADPV